MNAGAAGWREPIKLVAQRVSQQGAIAARPPPPACVTSAQVEDLIRLPQRAAPR
jgi:hypothetical protein